METNTCQGLWVTPQPPVVHDELAHVGAGLQFVENPTEYLRSLRQQYGDTFLVDIFGYKLFCVFSAEGLKNLYQLPEEEASFGRATFDLLSFKTPTEVFMDTDLQLFYRLLMKKLLPHYLDIIHRVLDSELNRWDDIGQVEIFDAIRTLEQRVGYGLWISEGAAEAPNWSFLKQQFDILNQESAFVDPAKTLATIKSNKAAEKQAVESIRAFIFGIILQREGEEQWPDDTLSQLCQHFAAYDPEERRRKVAHNIININQGFLSNLYAAIAWVIVRILQNPLVLDAVQKEIESTGQKFGDRWQHQAPALESMLYMEQLLMESVRTSQRSITLRKVLQPVSLDTGEGIYTVSPGAYITTLLSVTNMQTEELSKFDPGHYQGSSLNPALHIPGKETVSTFGHGKHACPAQRFSHMMCKAVVIRLLQSFELKGLFENPRPADQQMGGVARSQHPVRMHYRRLPSQ